MLAAQACRVRHARRPAQARARARARDPPSRAPYSRPWNDRRARAPRRPRSGSAPPSLRSSCRGRRAGRPLPRNATPAAPTSARRAATRATTGRSQRRDHVELLADRGTLGDLLEPLADAARQLKPEHVARANHPRQVRDRREPVWRWIERLQPLAKRVLLPAAERVVVGSELGVEAKHPPALECPLRGIRGEQRRLGVALLEVLHDHGRLRQHEGVLLEHRHPAGRILLVQPSGPVRKIDRDRLVGNALLREDDPNACAVGAARSVVERDHGCSPRTSAICLYSSSAGGSSPGLSPVRATARTRAASAPVSRETTVGFARSASASPGGSGPKYSGTERYSSTICPRSWMTKRTTAPASSVSRTVTPKRYESSTPSFRSTSWPKGSIRTTVHARPRSTCMEAPRTSRGRKSPTTRSTASASSLCTCSAPTVSGGGSRSRRSSSTATRRIFAPSSKPRCS